MFVTEKLLEKIKPFIINEVNYNDIKNTSCKHNIFDSSRISGECDCKTYVYIGKINNLLHILYLGKFRDGNIKFVHKQPPKPINDGIFEIKFTLDQFNIIRENIIRSEFK